MKALNDLNLFVETARQGSFSKAANSLSLTTAAVSAAIRRLEEQVQFPLFVRSTRHIRLTHEGEIFLAKTQTALATLQEGFGSDRLCAWPVGWPTAHQRAFRFGA